MLFHHLQINNNNRPNNITEESLLQQHQPKLKKALQLAITSTWKYLHLCCNNCLTVNLLTIKSFCKSGVFDATKKSWNSCRSLYTPLDYRRLGDCKFPEAQSSEYSRLTEVETCTHCMAAKLGWSRTSTLRDSNYSSIYAFESSAEYARLKL